MSHVVFGAVAATAVAALSLVLLVRLALRAHGRGPVHGHKPGSGGVLRVVGQTVRLLTRAGVRLGPVMLLTVAGRTTGVPRTNPVDVFARDGRYWLVATHTADAHWVRNLRVAGTGTLRRGRRSYSFTAVQLSTMDAAAVFQEVIGARLTRPLGGYVLRQTLGVSGDAGVDEFARVAAERPVFELAVTGAPLAHTVTGPVLAITTGLLIATAHTALGLTGRLHPADWISGAVIGLLLAGGGNHWRIFGTSRHAH